MLAVTAVPQGFEAQNDGDTKVQFEWLNTYANDVTFEIQASTTGLATPDLWRDVFTTITNKFNEDIDAYRSNYYRIRATEIGNTVSPWTDPSDPLDGNPRPANNPEDNTVKVSAISHPATPSIELKWPLELAYDDADYKIYRKDKGATSFVGYPATPLKFLDFEDTNRPDYPDPFTGWTDATLNGKTAYEYRVVRTRKDNDFFSSESDATGYVYAGVDVPLSDPDSTIESPGTVILIVDNTQAEALTTELDRLRDDLIAEGWDVIRHDVAPHNDDRLLNTHDDVRDLIKADYTAQADVTSVFLIGHVPIPMSGNSNPDGHAPRPLPADVFYGDMDGMWKLGSNASGASSVFAIDLDGDGDTDAISSSTSDDTIAWYENDGSGGFTKRTIDTAADDARSVFAIDLDGDGDIDVLSASYNDDKIARYENRLNESAKQDFKRRIITKDPDGVLGPQQGEGDGASSMGATGDGEIIPRKYLTRASDSDIVQVTGRGTLLAIAI